MQQAQVRQWWRIAFVAYGVLSLSFMAGMGVGSGLFALLTLSYIAVGWKNDGRKILQEAFSTPYSWISLFFFLACLLSLLMAMAFPVEGSQAGPMLRDLKKFHYFFLPPLIGAAFLATSDRLEDHPFWKAWALMGAFLGVVAMVQFFGAVLFPEPWLASKFFRTVGRTDRFHGQGLMFFHLSFASCMCFVSSAAGARLFFPRAMDTIRVRWFWAAVALLGSLGVYYSYSRIAFAAVGVGIVVLGFLKRPRYGVYTLIALLLAGSGLWFSSESLRIRFIYGVSGTKERVAMWKSAWGMFEERPLTGVGFSRTGELSPWFAKKYSGDRTTEFTSHAHNNILDVLGATGSIGLIAFLLWWGFLFWGAWIVFRKAPPQEKWLPAAAIAGFLTFQINGLTQVNFWDGKSEHTLMIWAGVVIALWLREKRRERV